MTRTICPALFLLAAMAAHRDVVAGPDPEKWLAGAQAAYAKSRSYTAIFHKQQRVGGELLADQTILLKCRKKPFSLYMKWLTEPFKGSELLYVAGWNEDRIRAHRGGTLRFITRNIDPGDRGLLAGNLRPVTSTGIGYLLQTVALKMRKAIEASELTFSEHGEENVYGRSTQILEVVLPRDKAK
jgi:hypothetical protein